MLIPDDTLYYHIATQNGDYGVVVSNPNGCQSGVNISNVTIGIYETVDSKLVTLYPNPTSDRVEISYNSMTNDIAFISIIDKIGQVVKSVEYKSATGSNKFELNTSELSSGIYTIQISIGSKLISKMLMINK
ncbi:MAG: T9SS type A sorting domain-containing protein [Bacteroidetes bacterium]|nr:T9SS type A sorting domain-containing protein [Bacteroidota bacterium]